MPVPVIMPKVDMDQEKATIISWEKAEGDEVKYDETLLTVETEKVSIDVNSPADGILAGILFENGAVVPVATVIAYILKPGEKLDAPGHSAHKNASSPSSNTDKPEVLPEKSECQATPVAQRIAKELNIDLSDVPTKNRIINREDVEAYAASLSEEANIPDQKSDKIAATPAARRVAKEKGISLSSLQGSGPHGRIQEKDVKPTIPDQKPTIATRDAVIVPMSSKRAYIAQKMQSSFQIAPHIAETIDADVSQLEAMRSRLNANIDPSGKDKVTFTAIMVKLVAWALKQNPYLNSSLIEDQIHLWKEINIGVATALEDGLIVPVISDADKLSFKEIAYQLNDLTQRAKLGKIGLSEVQRGTFTISNLGMYGITQFRAIINPPEVGILAVSSVVRKPIVIDHRDTIAVRPILNLTLSADHRVIDGVVAAKFLANLASVIEHPEILYE